MHAMVRLADQLLVLDHGQRAGCEVRPAEVTRNPSVIEAYLGKKWVKPVLQVESLSVAYGGLRAPERRLARASGRGQFVAIVGPNGAGKTTLFKAISGIVAAVVGANSLRWARSGDGASGAARTLGIAHVPEGRQVFKSMTVLENLEMGAYLPAGPRRPGSGISSADPAPCSRACRPPRRSWPGPCPAASSRWWRSAVVSRHRRKLLLLDEPSMGLAPTVADQIFERIEEIHRQDKLATLLVEQRVVEALHSCDVGYVLETGRGRAGGIQRDAAGRRPGQEGVSWDVSNGVEKSQARKLEGGQGDAKNREKILHSRRRARNRGGAGARSGQVKEVKVALIAPFSGPWARQGDLMLKGAQMAIDDINAQGGIKALGGAKMKLVVIDAGDSIEKAKNAAQRMVAQETDVIGCTGAWLSSFTLAVTEVTERAELPCLTLSYSDQITARGFRYIFQTSPTGNEQAIQALPTIIEAARSPLPGTH